MCGRYFVDPDDTPEELERMLEQLENREQRHDQDFRMKRGEICPGDVAAVIALNRARIPSVFAMKWGFPMEKRLIINARSETAAQRVMFRESMQLRRCLIPASAYFEWDHREKKPTKYRFSLPGEELLYLAGLYRLESDRPVFTVLTREATPEIACFHDRMPVIAAKTQVQRWLDQQAAPEALLDHPQTDLVWHAVT